MTFDVSRLRRGERIAAIGGVLLFILLFFDWYDVSINTGIAGIGSIGGSVSAWDAFSLIDIYLLITVIVAIGLATLTATQQTPALPVTASVITTAVAALGTLLVLFRIVDTPSLGLPSAIDVSPTFWAFVGLVVTAGITYGGYLSMREEGTTLSDVKAQASVAGAQARAAFDGSGSATEAPGAPPSAVTPPPPPPPPPPSAPPASEPPAESAPPMSPSSESGGPSES